MAQAAARKRASPAPAGYSRGRTENLLPALRVTYYRQMRARRVYQVTVGWQKGKVRPPSGAEPIRIRLIMAGAQVIPSEQVLDPSDPDTTGSFYVTPLAEGKLRGEHLEVLIQGRKVQELALPTKVASQRMTWILLALTILAPWFIYNNLRPRAAGEVIPVEAKDLLPKKALAWVVTHVPSLPGVVKETSTIGAAFWRMQHEFTRDHPPELYWGGGIGALIPLELYWAAGIGVLMLLSWWMHRPKRKWRVGPPIPLPRPATEFSE